MRRKITDIYNPAVKRVKLPSRGRVSVKKKVLKSLFVGDWRIGVAFVIALFILVSLFPGSHIPTVVEDAEAVHVTFARVQNKTSEGDPAAPTYDTTPVEGNLLVAIAMERSGTTEADFTISGSGWTKRIGHDTELGDTQARRTMVVWTKVAGASEPTNISVDNGTANTKKLMIQEFQAGTAVTWTLPANASSSADTGTGSTSPLPTGSTGSLNAGDLLLVTAGIWRNEDNDPGSIAWSNGIGNILNDLGGTNARSISSGFAQESSGGTKSSSLSWTGANHEATAGILVFSAVGNTAPSITGSGCGGDSISATPDPVTEGSIVNFCVDWDDPDAGDTDVEIYVCKTTGITPGTGCDGGGTDTWTAVTGTTDDPETDSLPYTTTGADVGPANNYHVYVCDDEPECSTVRSGTFTVNASGGGPVTFARAQAELVNEGTSPSVSVTPTVGNLLVAIAFERSGTDAVDFSITGSGWAQHIADDTLNSDTLRRRTLIVWAKVATGNETIQVSGGGTTKLMVQEFEAGTPVTWNFEGQSSGDTDAGSTGPLSTGLTPSIGAGDLLAIGVAGWRREGTNTLDTITWTNGIGSTVEDIGGNNARSISTGFVQDSSGGTKETQVDWNGTGHEATAGILVFSAVGAGGSPPTVTTNAATGPTSSSATLNGDANPNGDGTTGWFRYSSTDPGSCNDTFGAKTATSSLGSGTSTVSYSENITGLSPSTPYFFCAIAENTNGKAFGSVLPFTTSASGGGGGPITYIRSGGATATSFSLDIGSAGTDRLVTVIAGDENSTGIDLTGVTVDGKACNLVVRAENPDTTKNHQEMWYCDEDDLGASAGTVTVAISGGAADWGVHARLFTGVDQTGPKDWDIDDTSVSTTTVTADDIAVPPLGGNGLTVSANGLVVMGAGHGQSAAFSSMTSPLGDFQNGPHPSSAILASGSGVETSAQTDKSYIGTFVSIHNRGTAIAATWDEVAAGPSAVLTQSAYRFFANLDSTNVASPFAVMNTPMSLSASGEKFRLRTLVHIDIATLTQNGENFKLQFAGKGGGTCSSPSGSPAIYTDVTGSTVIAYNNNPTPSDGTALSVNSEDPTHGAHTIKSQTYEEANNFTNSEASISVSEDGQWDFALIDNGAPTSTTYCLRIVKSDNSLLDSYGVYPEMSTVGGSSLLGSLISSTFDTGFFAGVKINSILWRGFFGTGGSNSVKFQIASSNCSNGATDVPVCTTNVGWGGKTDGDGAFIGSDGSSSTYYIPSAPDTTHILPTDHHSNKRYFRYLVELTRDPSSSSPVVQDIIINWSP